VRVVFCGTGWFPIVEHIRRRLPAHATIEIRDFSRPLADAVSEADVVIPSNARLDDAAFRSAARLKLVQQTAVGVDGIDLDAARARGIPVCNSPAANAEAVAEAALLLMLALARRWPLARRSFEHGEIGVPLGRELAGKVLGVVGLGRSGARLAHAARALGMEVVSVRSGSGGDAFFHLLARADVVSIHCPLTPATRSLFDDAAFARMKPGALLVNTARGPIVDRGAVERALGSGHLGGVGLDVHWEEPWDPADPLYARDDVVALPHLAGSTEEAFARLAGLVAENLRRLEAGEELLHRIA
jgi:phosphoglycerate dehydrogenase-like enzyme